MTEPIPSLFETLEEKINPDLKNQASTSEKSSCTIFKLPDDLKDRFSATDETSFIPETVSLGPYHTSLALLVTDDHKVRALNSVVNYSPIKLKIYVDSISELEEVARSRYEGGAANLDKDQFVKLLLLDGSFIFEIIKGYHKGFEEYPANDPVFSKRGSNSIIRDMIKVGNQIPFIVLRKLSELHFKKAEEIAKLAAFMFIRWLTGERLDDGRLDTLNAGDVNYLHCLHLFQHSLLIDIAKERTLNNILDSSLGTFEGKNDTFMHNATDLMEYGINFKQQKKGWRPFWDMKFENGTLEMPRLFLNNGRVKIAFENLIIFEQQSRRCENVPPIITEYVVFMDKLITSATDVGHLHEVGIIVHQLKRSDTEVVSLFNDLGKAAFLEPNKKSYYIDLYMKIQRHCNRGNRWKSELKRKYFSNPWTFVSFLAAIALLVLTFLQSYYTVYSYYWPTSKS